MGSSCLLRATLCSVVLVFHEDVLIHSNFVQL